MLISTEVHGDVLSLRVEETRIDAAGALIFKETVRDRLADHAGRVVLDMENVEFLDSSGLGSLVAVMKMLDGDRRLELARSGPLVVKVLRLTRMDRVFVLHEDLPWTAPDDQDAA
ncbi:MAG: STAS domain-containing protein [Jannaschia sp.]